MLTKSPLLKITVRLVTYKVTVIRTQSQNITLNAASLSPFLRDILLCHLMARLRRSVTLLKWQTALSCEIRASKCSGIVVGNTRNLDFSHSLPTGCCCCCCFVTLSELLSLPLLFSLCLYLYVIHLSESIKASIPTFQSVFGSNYEVKPLLQSCWGCYREDSVWRWF